MKLACKCLNIEITSLSKQFEDIDPSIKKLFERGMIFEEDLVTIEVTHVVKRLPNLVEENITSLWQIYRCINCGMWAYASPKQIGANNALINKQLLSDINVMEKLRQSDKYSPVFKIIINSGVLKDPINTESQDYLDPIAINWLKEQSLQTEERIKEFCENEYLNLEQLKLRVHKDQLAINRLLLEKKKVNKSFSFRRSPELKRSTSKSSSTKVSNNDNLTSSHYDSDRIFELDEFDPFNNDPLDDSNSEVSDDDVTEPSFHRRTANPNLVARSLPIAVPQFMEEKKSAKSNWDHGQNEQSIRAPNDIAASIKALAKSVHGDTVFGELPRPRFSTNL